MLSSGLSNSEPTTTYLSIVVVDWPPPYGIGFGGLNLNISEALSLEIFSSEPTNGTLLSNLKPHQLLQMVSLRNILHISGNNMCIPHSMG